MAASLPGATLSNVIPIHLPPSAPPASSSTPSAPLARPDFRPVPTPYRLQPAESPVRWTPVISCPAHYPRKAYEIALEQMVFHPERSSGLILRADVISDTGSGGRVPLEASGRTQDHDTGDMQLEVFDDIPGSTQDRWKVTRKVKLALLPRKPGTDASLRQRCTFLRRNRKSTRQIATTGGSRDSTSDELDDAEPNGAEKNVETLVIMTAVVDAEEDVPYYHPSVRSVAFRWSPISPDEDTVPSFPAAEAASRDTATDPAPSPLGQLQLFVLPFRPILPNPNVSPPSVLCPSSGRPIDPLQEETRLTAQNVLSNRLYRTCLHLLETADKFAWGVVVGYKKRVETDAIIDKATFQDLYLLLKSRHKHLDSRPPRLGSNQVVDVKRHVWKDIAIAAFLMLLWKGMYPARISGTGEHEGGDMGQKGQEVVLPNGKRIQLRREVMEWDDWGRPPGGFLDLGCGNGLLVHILVTEGYEGKGLELRSRKTWPAYPERTRHRLIEHAINPPSWFPSSMKKWRAGQWEGREKCPIGEGMFLIGNHADEMTPWIPLLSLIPAAPVPYLSLPCCLHTLTSMFTKTTFKIPLEPSGLDDIPISDEDLGYGIDIGKYGAYVKWLGWIGAKCGWEWERESLRIPSTRGWGIVARNRWTRTGEQDWGCREHALKEVLKVRAAGGFSVRKAEGAAHHE